MMLVLAPALSSAWMDSVTNKEKKMMEHRNDLFERNGGNLLRKKLSKSRKKKKKNSQILRIYTAQDMKRATSNYTSTRVMHRSSPGIFYCGVLPDDNTELLVVKIQRVPASQIKRFVDQLIFLSQPHRNLVRIMGCCLETESPLLVYELNGDRMTGNTLFNQASSISFEKRVRAATGAARALAHMHSHNSRVRLVHGNVSSSNIFLDDTHNHAKLLYTLADISSTGQENHVYRAPEFISSGQLDDKSDVYSFGVILGEVLIVDRQEFVSVDTERIANILNNPGIEGDTQQAKEVAALAARCLSVEVEKRPNMKEVEAKLLKLCPTSVGNLPCLGHSSCNSSCNQLVLRWNPKFYYGIRAGVNGLIYHSSQNTYAG